jgi:hypothetical protein
MQDFSFKQLNYLWSNECINEAKEYICNYFVQNKKYYMMYIPRLKNYEILTPDEMQSLYLRKFPKELATWFLDENCNTYEFQPPTLVQEQLTLPENKLKEEVISTLITQVITKEEETKKQPAPAQLKKEPTKVKVVPNILNEEDLFNMNIFPDKPKNRKVIKLDSDNDDEEAEKPKPLPKKGFGVLPKNDEVHSLKSIENKFMKYGVLTLG